MIRVELKKELTWTSGGPEKISEFTSSGRLDVDDVEYVTVAEKIVNSPFESDFASFGKVQGNPNIPITAHRFTFAKSWVLNNSLTHCSPSSFGMVGLIVRWGFTVRSKTLRIQFVITFLLFVGLPRVKCQTLMFW